MSQGWVKVYRELLDKPIWLNSTANQKTILITLLLMVNHKANQWEWKGEKFNIKPGQMITSLESIKNKAGQGITIDMVRKAIKRFQKMEFLTNESTKEGRLISVINWSTYQSEDEEQTIPQTKARPKRDHLTRMIRIKRMEIMKIYIALNPKMVQGRKQFLKCLSNQKKIFQNMKACTKKI